jgi:hypothetical protein
VPRADLAKVRRAGRDRRRTRLLRGLVGGLSAVGAVSALIFGSGAEPEETADPVAVPAMDFSRGLRGFHDAESGLTHLGGQTFDLGTVQDLGTSASVTPYGLVFFGTNQAVRLLSEDGRVRTIAAAPARPDDFQPSAKYDPGRGLVAWLTKARGEVTLSVYEFGAGPRLIGSYPVPCSAASCSDLSIAGVDQGTVFVRGDGRTRLLDPAAGQQAGWAAVTDGWVADVRNRVILTTRKEPSPLPQWMTDAGWRLAPARGPESLLTLTGSHELTSSADLVPLAVGATGISLALPPGEGPLAATVDSDGTVLVVRSEGDTDVVYDCRLTGACEELARLAGSGSAALLGHDM